MFFFLLLTLVTGSVSLSLMQPCSMSLSERHVIMNLLPSFSSNGRTDVLSTECSARGLRRTWSQRFYLSDSVFDHHVSQKAGRETNNNPKDSA